MTLDKASLRSHLLERRTRLAHAMPEAAGAVATLVASLDLPASSCVAGYAALNSELDIMPALERLVRAGHPVALPVVGERNAPLTFRQWWPGQALLPGRWNTRQPPDTALSLIPTVFLVPLLGFDRRGNRLGYGGGFYDRTLAIARLERRVLAYGIAFAEQEVEVLPHDHNDAALDGVVTERGVIRV